MHFFRKNKLVTAIMLALVLGIITGYFINIRYTSIEEELSTKYTHPLIKNYIQEDFKSIKENIASNFSLLSEIFLRLIKMIIAPLVLSVLISGIGKIENIAVLGRIGLKTLIYFSAGK